MIYIDENYSLIILNMNYSVEITDSQGKIIGGSSNIPITFTVKKTDHDWRIIYPLIAKNKQTAPTM